MYNKEKAYLFANNLALKLNGKYPATKVDTQHDQDVSE
jgi:hypothetical protein